MTSGTRGRSASDDDFLSRAVRSGAAAFVVPRADSSVPEAPADPASATGSDAGCAKSGEDAMIRLTISLKIGALVVPP
jgi:hypothetical protein